jgi:hypothetical protein
MNIMHKHVRFVLELEYGRLYERLYRMNDRKPRTPQVLAFTTLLSSSLAR